MCGTGICCVKLHVNVDADKMFALCTCGAFNMLVVPVTFECAIRRGKEIQCDCGGSSSSGSVTVWRRIFGLDI